MDMEPLPQYVRIAIDIASRIASDEIKVDTKISGRSTLASEYNVSPETIRKSVNLLADMRVVEVKEKKGIFVISKDNAKRYIENSHYLQEREMLKNELSVLLKDLNGISERISDITLSLLKSQSTPLPNDKALPNYEVRLSDTSDKIGKTVGELRFWQSTGATIVGIRRNKYVILSPGPYAELFGGDAVVFVGPEDCVDAVKMFLNGNLD